MPDQPNTVSVMTAPPSSVMMSTGTIEASGSRALRNACRMITVRSVRPFDLAVRM